MPERTQLVIVGGGPAALEAILAVQHLTAGRVDITVVCDREDFVYRPVSVAEPFGFAATERFSLARIAADRGFRLRRGVLASVDANRRCVQLADGSELAYGILLLAVGARGVEAVPGALTFRGPQDVQALHDELERLHAGEPLRVAFVAAPETLWTLPLYELALLTARWAGERELALEPWIVTYEHRPLNLFGEEAAAEITELLVDAGVRVWTGAFAESYEQGKVWVSMEGGLPAELAVALPRLVGPRVDGLPCDADGFVPVDAQGRVDGLFDVFAAGDMTTKPLKQGGLAAQQADVAAAAIAESLGADVEATAYRPVLRAMLLTGGRPRYLRRAAHAEGTVSDEAPWWPPHKIAGRELAPYLTAHPELRVGTTSASS
jgi:sulfide:quinone oxidoreductase